MLISPHFVFMHMPKTGGGTVTHVLRTTFERNYLRSGPGPRPHPGRQHIPPAASDLPILGFVRNPWDWYVSWYHFHRERYVPTRLWRSAFGSGDGFAAVVRAACTGALDHNRPELKAAMLGGADFYSARLAYTFGDLGDECLTLGRFERLFEDLEEFLERVGAPLPEDFGDRAGVSPVVNAGERGDYRDYYDAELRDLVGERCAAVCERFGYTF